MNESKFARALRSLCEAGVQFILVGGVAAALHGITIDTLDVDIVPMRTEENLARLLAVLESLDAVYRIQPERRLKPTPAHLQSRGHQNLITTLGPLDVLGTIGRGHGYEDLLPHTVEIQLGDGTSVRMLDLETIIAIKEEVGGEKDLAALPLLRRALKERQKPTP